jgi:hypothetical protein
VGVGVGRGVGDVAVVVGLLEGRRRRSVTTCSPGLVAGRVWLECSMLHSPQACGDREDNYNRLVT